VDLVRLHKDSRDLLERLADRLPPDKLATYRTYSNVGEWAELVDVLCASLVKGPRSRSPRRSATAWPDCWPCSRPPERATPTSVTRSASCLSSPSPPRSGVERRWAPCPRRVLDAAIATAVPMTPGHRPGSSVSGLMR